MQCFRLFFYFYCLSHALCKAFLQSPSNVASKPFFSTTSDNAQTKTAKEEENPRLTGLALMLDDGTRKSHSVAQNSAFVTGFFKGLANRNSYRSLITSLYFVYTAME